MTMAEYIEREAFKKAFDIAPDEWCKGRTVNRILDEIPAADVVEVVHGRWVGLEYDGYADGCPVYDLWECSECGEEVSGEYVPDTHPFCYGCGTKMDGGNNA